ncbi:ARM repeat-containing protein [Rozella allomycis CSF55]|uniref:ARM repeat-containing protein n=1 Tax=Rozella allomycis (strain CSF55) TaxID=988480 RepID=A0A4V1IZY4_ROZAC|nr:ARM repeat-containing protein [Rozella allomycis CSF55]
MLSDIEENVLRKLESNDSRFIIESIDELQKSILFKDPGKINHQRLIEILKIQLKTSNYEILINVLKLVQFIAQIQNYNIQKQLIELVPSLLDKCVDARPSIRKEAIHTIQKIASNATEECSIVSVLINQGCENEDWKYRKATIEIIRDIGCYLNDKDIEYIIKNVIPLLNDVSDMVKTATINCLKHFHSLIEQEYFDEIIARSNIQLFEKYHEQIVQSKVGLNISNLKNDVKAQKHDFKQSLDISKSTSRPPTGKRVSIHTNGNVESLLDDFGKLEIKDRSEKMEKIHNMIKNSKDAHQLTLQLKSSVEDIFESLLSFSEDHNFKISMLAFSSLNELVVKLETSINKHLAIFVPRILTKLGDSKTLIKQLIFRILNYLLKSQSANCILPFVFQKFQDSNYKVREESVNVFIVTALSTKINEINLKEAINNLTFLLKDERTRVRFVATEAIAVLGKKYGSETVLDIMENVGVDEGILFVIRLRFENQCLPTLSSDGTLDHIAMRSQSVSRPASVEISELAKKEEIRREEIVESLRKVTENNVTKSVYFESENRRISTSNPSKRSTPVSVQIDENSKGVPFRFNSYMSSAPVQKNSITLEEEKKRSVSIRAESCSVPQIHNKPKNEIKVDEFCSIEEAKGYWKEGSKIRKDDEKKRTKEIHKVSLMTENKKNIKEIIKDIKSSDDWQVKAQGLVELERGIQDEPFSGNFSVKEVCLVLIECMLNLRSQVSKAAISATGQAAVHLNKHLDLELDALVGTLFKKSLDGNNFIQDQVNKTLALLCENVSKNRLLVSVLHHSEQKSVVVRLKVVTCIEKIVCDQPVSNLSKILKNIDNEKLVQTLSNFVFDGNQSIRKSARNSLCQLNTNIDVVKLLEKSHSISSYKVKEIKQILENHPIVKIGNFSI